MSNIKNFVFDAGFYGSLKDLKLMFKHEGLDINDLPDKWAADLELCTVEPIFPVTPKSLYDILADYFDDRITEEFDDKNLVISVLKECIDFKRLEKRLPRLYFETGEVVRITKDDLLNA